MREKRGMRFLLILVMAAIVSLTALAGYGSAHTPSEMVLKYDFFNQELSVTITHSVLDPNTHYIESVEVLVNGIQVIFQEYTSQPSSTTFTYTYNVTAEGGDEIEVTATCNIAGGITRQIDIIEPAADEIVLLASPNISAIDENTFQVFTISASAGGEPLEGVLFDIDVKLGSASSPQMVTSGQYNFTYTSPDVNRALEETIDIRGEKEGLQDGDIRIQFTVNEAGDTGGDCPPTLDGVIEAGEYEFTAEFDGGNLKLHWRLINDTMLMAMEGQTTGWMSIGIEPENRMEGADMIFGWVTDSGEVNVVDAYATGPTGPHPPDTEQGGTSDILCFGGSESGGRTVVEFKRLLTTGDGRDKAIPSSGEMMIIWAHSESDDFDSQHTSRGYGTLDIKTGEFTEFEPPAYWLIHAVLMFLGFLLMIIGVIIAKAFKKKKWWFSRHKLLGAFGSVVAFPGLVLGFVMVELSTGEHFRVPHAYVGVLGLIFIIITPVLGFAIAKVKKGKKRIRMIHRWCGRITLVLMLLNIIFGLSVAGVV